MGLTCCQGGLAHSSLVGSLNFLLELWRLLGPKKLQLRGVVGFTIGTLQTKPVVPRDTPAVAIVAEYVSSIVAVLLWHWLIFNVSVEPAELTLHVGNAFGANGTLVTGVAPLRKARLMNTVSTSHEGDRLVRRKHVLSADRTVTLGTSFNTFMGAFCLDRHASSAFLAVEEIFPEAFSQPTNPTVIAMINGLAGIIVP